MAQSTLTRSELKFLPDPKYLTDYDILVDGGAPGPFYDTRRIPINLPTVHTGARLSVDSLTVAIPTLMVDIDGDPPPPTAPSLTHITAALITASGHILDVVLSDNDVPRPFILGMLMYPINALKSYNPPITLLSNDSLFMEITFFRYAQGGGVPRRSRLFLTGNPTDPLFGSLYSPYARIDLRSTVYGEGEPIS